MKAKLSLGAVLGAGCLSIAAGTALADGIYKQVDSQGNVTYSSTPLKGGGAAERLDVPDRPSAEDVAAARRQLEQEKQQVEAYEDERRWRDEEAERLSRERRAREREASAAGPQPAAGDSETVYSPLWVNRRRLPAVGPWPRPESGLPTTLPATPQAPLMAPPKRPPTAHPQ